MKKDTIKVFAAGLAGVLILGALVAYSLWTRQRDDNMTISLGRISNAEVALDLYQIDHGSPLLPEQGLTELTKKTTKLTPRARLLQSDETLTDAWGTPLRYLPKTATGKRQRGRI
jgi:hypothetical protein